MFGQFWHGLLLWQKPQNRREKVRKLVGQQGHGTDFAKLFLQLLPGIAPVFTHVHIAKDAGRDDYVGPFFLSGYPVDIRVGFYRLSRFIMPTSVCR